MDEFLQQFRAEYPQYGDLSNDELARALHTKFYSDMSWEDFQTKVGQRSRVQEATDAGRPSIGPSGPSEQPANPTLSPAIGGAMDFATVLANGVGMGLPGALIPAVGERIDEIKERNPKMTTAMTVAGGALTGVGLARGAAGGAFGHAAARAASPTGFAITGPNMLQRSLQVGGLLGRSVGGAVKSRAAQLLGAGTAGGLLTRWIFD